MLGLLAAFAADDGDRLEPALSALLTDSVLARTEGNLSDAELRANYARARQAAAGMAGVPAAHAVLLFRAAEIGAQLVYRGTGGAGLADEVAAAFRAARAGLPARHPLAAQFAARAAAFESARHRPQGPVAGRLTRRGPPRDPRTRRLRRETPLTFLLCSTPSACAPWPRPAWAARACSRGRQEPSRRRPPPCSPGSTAAPHGPRY